MQALDILKRSIKLNPDSYWFSADDVSIIGHANEYELWFYLLQRKDNERYIFLCLWDQVCDEDCWFESATQSDRIGSWFAQSIWLFLYNRLIDYNKVFKSLFHPIAANDLKFETDPPEFLSYTDMGCDYLDRVYAEWYEAFESFMYKTNKAHYEQYVVYPVQPYD